MKNLTNLCNTPLLSKNKPFKETILNGVRVFVASLERFHSRDQRPYWLIQIKDDFCIKLEFIFPEERVGIPFWAPFHCFGTPIWLP